MARMRTSALALALTLGACVPSRGQLYRPIDRALAAQGVPAGFAADDPATAAAVRAALAAPLTLADAVRVALVHNRDLRVVMAEVGIAGADLAVASGLRPLEVDATWKFAFDGHGSELELTAVQDVLDLVRVGARRGVARARLGAAQARAIGATLRLATDVEIAVIELAAAQQRHAAQQVALDAATAAADLAQRMFDAGNTSALTLAEEQAQREVVAVAHAQTAAAVTAARLQLAARLGIDDAAAIATLAVAAPLAEVPAASPALDDLEAVAVAASQARQALVAEVTAAQAERREAGVRAWLPELSVGASVGQHDGSWAAGPALRIGVPLLGQGQGARARADAEVVRATLAREALDGRVRAHARDVVARVASAHAEARRLVDKVVPLRRAVLAELVRQYNAMNASTFELLAARAALVDAEQAALDAARRYATAMAEATGLRRGAALDGDGGAP